MSVDDLKSKFLDVKEKASKHREKAEELEKLANSYSHVLRHMGFDTDDLLARIEKSNNGHEEEIPWDELRDQMERILKDFPDGLHYKRLHELLISNGVNVGPVSKFRFKAYRLKNFGFEINKGEIKKINTIISSSWNSLTPKEQFDIEQHEKALEEEKAREKELEKEFYDSQEEEDPW